MFHRARAHLTYLLCKYFVNAICLYGEQLLAPRPIPKLEDHPLSAVRVRLFDTFAATLYTAGRSSIRNPRTRHSVVTGTHLSRRAQTAHDFLRNLRLSALYIVLMIPVTSYLPGQLPGWPNPESDPGHNSARVYPSRTGKWTTSGNAVLFVGYPAMGKVQEPKWHVAI